MADNTNQMALGNTEATFQNPEVQRLSKQVQAEIEQIKQEIRHLWGAKKEVVDRITALEKGGYKQHTIDSPRHRAIRQVLDALNEDNIGRKYFCGKKSEEATGIVLAYASKLDITELMNEDEMTGIRSTITGEIQRYYNLDRDPSTTKFYDPFKAK